MPHTFKDSAWVMSAHMFLYQNKPQGQGQVQQDKDVTPLTPVGGTAESHGKRHG